MEDAQGRAAYEELLRHDSGAHAQAAEDPDRPRYHFLPEPGWMNDPIPFFADGRFHVFFQYNPRRPYWGDMHWGHTASADLVHWDHLPVALAPTPGGPDADGCWTGCVVHAGGRYHALYTGVDPQVQCLASSVDLATWAKDPGSPVIPTSQKPASLGDTFRDPCVWRAGDAWYVVLGADLPGGGGSPLLYRSRDLRQWQFLHALYAGPAAGDECPDFFPLDGRHVLLSSRGQSVWAVGRFADLRFTPQAHGVLDPGELYAVKTLEDDGGRRLAWGWVRESRPVREQVRAGWSGVLSLPRVLRVLPGGTLGMEPPEELASLRGEGRSVPCPPLEGTSEEAPARIEVPPGGCFEVQADFDAGGGAAIGVVVPGAGAITWRGAGGRVRVFVDRSVAEVFVGGRETITRRAYRADGGGAGWLGLFARDGKAAVGDLRVWELRG